jgi:hypothetical protein
LRGLPSSCRLDMPLIRPPPAKQNTNFRGKIFQNKNYNCAPELEASDLREKSFRLENNMGRGSSWRTPFMTPKGGILKNVRVHLEDTPVEHPDKGIRQGVLQDVLQG